MNKLILLLLILSLCFFSGCSTHSPKIVKTIAPNTIEASTEEILDSARLKKGGRFVIIPFTSGPDVISNQESERLALLMVKGITGALQEWGSPFEVISGEEAISADLVLKGRIVQFDPSEKPNKWFSKNKQLHLKVDILMVDQETGSVVFHLIKAQTSSASDENRDFELMAMGLGQAIGRVILDCLRP